MGRLSSLAPTGRRDWPSACGPVPGLPVRGPRAGLRKRCWRKTAGTASRRWLPECMAGAMMKAPGRSCEGCSQGLGGCRQGGPPPKRPGREATASAPGILPVKAKRVPVPIATRRALVVKAAPAAHQGPRSTPATVLTGVAGRGSSVCRPNRDREPGQHDSSDARRAVRTSFRIGRISPGIPGYRSFQRSFRASKRPCPRASIPGRRRRVFPPCGIEFLGPGQKREGSFEDIFSSSRGASGTAVK